MKNLQSSILADQFEFKILPNIFRLLSWRCRVAPLLIVWTVEGRTNSPVSSSWRLLHWKVFRVIARRKSIPFQKHYLYTLPDRSRWVGGQEFRSKILIWNLIISSKFVSVKTLRTERWFLKLEQLMPTLAERSPEPSKTVRNGHRFWWLRSRTF